MLLEPDEQMLFQVHTLNKLFVLVHITSSLLSLLRQLFHLYSEPYKKPNTIIVSDHKYYLNKLNKINVNITYLSPDASHLANSFFNGYGVDNLEIIYHHTYYK